MLQSHLAAVENHILAISKIPANAGHPLHKGTPRESFIEEFLTGHLNDRIAVGKGEIIDAESKPNEPRPQIDIVLYKKDYPRLHLGGGLHAFLVESVIATIEVKSLLTKEELSKAFATAIKVKKLKSNRIVVAVSGYNAPGILSFIVAYDGPASMKTVYGWLADIYSDHCIPETLLPPTQKSRCRVPSPAIDGVFCLGKGYLHYDNCPFGLVQDEQRRQNPAMKWQYADTETGSLLTLFLWLTATACNSTESWLNPDPYLDGFYVPPGSFWFDP